MNRNPRRMSISATLVGALFGLVVAFNFTDASFAWPLAAIGISAAVAGAVAYRCPDEFWSLASLMLYLFS